MINEVELTDNIFQQAKETFLLVLESRVRNHEELENGWMVGTRENVWADFFITGVNTYKAGGELPKGTNEKTIRGYNCQKKYAIGSK